MTKQFDVSSISGEVVAQVNVEETTLVRDILQQISDITGTPAHNMSLVHSGDLEAPSALCPKDACLSKECFVEGAQTSLTVVILDNGKEPEPAEVSVKQEFDFHHVVKKLTPCVKDWVWTAMILVATFGALGLAMGVFVGFIFCCAAMDTEEGPNLLEKICFGTFTSGGSISLIWLVARSAYNAIVQGKFCGLLQTCASMAIWGVAALSALGLAAGSFIGFIFCCVAMDTEEGPNLLEKICFGIFVSGASISLICLVARSAYNAIVQGKFCELLQTCVSTAIWGVAVLSALGLAVGSFIGFIFCCVKMDTEEGPNLLEKICFGIFVSGASISLICLVARSAYNAIDQGKFCELLQTCASTAIGVVGALSAFGLAMGAFIGFTFCCVKMGSEEGPNLLEKIYFVVFLIGVTFACCGIVCKQIRNALNS